MIRKLLCVLGRHEFLFAYVQVGTAYVAEVACIRCLKRATPAQEAARALRCLRGNHQVQALTAPPTWRKGDGWQRGNYCIWCAMPDGPRVLDDRFGRDVGGDLINAALPSTGEYEKFAVWPKRAPESRW